MLRLFSLFVYMPMMWFSTNSITGGGSRFSGKKDENNKSDNKDDHVQLLEQLINELNIKIIELENMRNMIQKLLTSIKSWRIR